jgi:hypothetical protein
MTQGYIFLGIDDDKTTNIEAAYALSISLKMADPTRETAVVVTKWDDVPAIFEDGFDYIVELPFGRSDVDHHNIAIDFWQIYYCTPFDENMYIDRYSLVIDNIDSLWGMADLGEMVFAGALDYRGEATRDDSQFQSCDLNMVTAFKSDVIYFTKSETNSQFFKMADPIFKGWRDIYREVLINHKPSDFDLNVMINVTAHLLGERFLIADHFDYTDLTINFTFDPEVENDSWIDDMNIWMTDTNSIKVNNHNQCGMFHYGTPSVLTADMMKKLNERFSKR